MPKIQNKNGQWIVTISKDTAEQVQLEAGEPVSTVPDAQDHNILIKRRRK